MVKESNQKHENRIELITLIGALLLAFLCMCWVGYIIIKSMNTGNPVPEYAITPFVAVTTLIVGYILGKKKNGK